MNKELINPMRIRLKACFKKSSLKKGVISFAGVFVMVGMVSEQVHVIKSSTDSLPKHYFVQLTQITPKKGDCTVVYNPFYGGRLIKKILGAGGDRIHTDASGELWVGQKRVGKVYPQTGDGRKLTPIPNQVIPEGQVFLYSPHPKSLDSRYQEVGLVPMSECEGIAIGIV
jgi:conjugal transfer pilin signal peptidase TrbI